MPSQVLRAKIGRIEKEEQNKSGMDRSYILKIPGFPLTGFLVKIEICQINISEDLMFSSTGIDRILSDVL